MKKIKNIYLLQIYTTLIFLNILSDKMKTSKKEKKGGEKVISRMYMCSPRDKERFFLRILLTQIHEATSYEAIHTINRILYDTFEEAIQ